MIFENSDGTFSYQTPVTGTHGEITGEAKVNALGNDKAFNYCPVLTTARGSFHSHPHGIYEIGSHAENNLFSITDMFTATKTGLPEYLSTPSDGIRTYVPYGWATWLYRNIPPWNGLGLG